MRFVRKSTGSNFSNGEPLGFPGHAKNNRWIQIWWNKCIRTVKSHLINDSHGNDGNAIDAMADLINQLYDIDWILDVMDENLIQLGWFDRWNIKCDRWNCIWWMKSHRSNLIGGGGDQIHHHEARRQASATQPQRQGLWAETGLHFHGIGEQCPIAN